MGTPPRSLIRRIYSRIMRTVRARLLQRKLARADELSRISYHPGVVHGERVRLTGAVNFGSEPFLVRLGSDITIADGVRFLTHDGGARVFRDLRPNMHVYAPVVVGDSVFIGVGCILMPGVTIGSRVVIGAGSIVTRDIPDGEVWAGVPARRLKSIDEYERGLIEKSFEWPTGQYDNAWRRALQHYWRERLQ